MDGKFDLVLVPKYTHISAVQTSTQIVVHREDKDLIGVGQLIVLKLCH